MIEAFSISHKSYERELNLTDARYFKMSLESNRYRVLPFTLTRMATIAFYLGMMGLCFFATGNIEELIHHGKSKTFPTNTEPEQKTFRLTRGGLHMSKQKLDEGNPPKPSPVLTRPTGPGQRLNQASSKAAETTATDKTPSTDNPKTSNSK